MIIQYENSLFLSYNSYFNFICIILQYLDDELDSIDDVEKYEKAHNFKVLFP